MVPKFGVIIQIHNQEIAKKHSIGVILSFEYNVRLTAGNFFGIFLMNVQFVSLQAAFVGVGLPADITEEVQLEFGLLFRDILLPEVNFPASIQ